MLPSPSAAAAALVAGFGEVRVQVHPELFRHQWTMLLHWLQGPSPAQSARYSVVLRRTPGTGVQHPPELVLRPLSRHYPALLLLLLLPVRGHKRAGIGAVLFLLSMLNC